MEPALEVPRHHVFHSGRRGDGDPRHYADAVARLAPEIDVRLVLPGTTVVGP
ncbi:hypothetical protein AB0C38_47535 [Amycolatopsis sp. NPDC048633]|uniref:hypothetical protein n=1 Tax=Amycolatopsis sp. NPDC048633 TaxID=3157095 RepID=UPI003408ABFF